MSWVAVALGEDCDTFIGEQYVDSNLFVTNMLKELTGATHVSRIRQTMDETWQAYCHKGSEGLGYFALYQEE